MKFTFFSVVRWGILFIRLPVPQNTFFRSGSWCITAFSKFLLYPFNHAECAVTQKNIVLITKLKTTFSQNWFASLICSSREEQLLNVGCGYNANKNLMLRSSLFDEKVLPPSTVIMRAFQKEEMPKDLQQILQHRKSVDSATMWYSSGIVFTYPFQRKRRQEKEFFLPIFFMHFKHVEVIDVGKKL